MYDVRPNSGPSSHNTGVPRYGKYLGQYVVALNFRNGKKKAETHSNILWIHKNTSENSTKSLNLPVLHVNMVHPHLPTTEISVSHQVHFMWRLAVHST